jgi:hypothetical protein
MTNDTDDAQRNMEQKALRNVRALVDKIENTDDHNRKAVLGTAVKIVVGVVVVIAIAAVAYITTHKPEAPRTLVLPPPGGAAPK